MIALVFIGLVLLTIALACWVAVSPDAMEFPLPDDWDFTNGRFTKTEGPSDPLPQKRNSFVHITRAAESSQGQDRPESPPSV